MLLLLTLFSSSNFFAGAIHIKRDTSTPRHKKKRLRRWRATVPSQPKIWGLPTALSWHPPPPPVLAAASTSRVSTALENYWVRKSKHFFGFPIVLIKANKNPHSSSSQTRAANPIDVPERDSIPFRVVNLFWCCTFNRVLPVNSFLPMVFTCKPLLR